MTPRKSVYLGGRINGLSYTEATEHRNEAARILRHLGFDVLDPMRKESAWQGPADDLTHVPDFRTIIEADEADIRAADYYLCLTGDSPSWGTGIEIGYAVYEQQIPVFAVGNTNPASGWLAHKAHVYPTIREACIAISAHSVGLPVDIIEFWLEGRAVA